MSYADRGCRVWIVALWGTEALHFAAVAPGGRFRLGTGRGAWPFPATLLGTPCHTLVDFSGSVPRVCFPGAAPRALAPGREIVGEIGPFRLVATYGPSHREGPGLRRGDALRQWLGWWSLAAATTAAILAVAALAVPRLEPSLEASIVPRPEPVLLAVGAGGLAEPEAEPPDRARELGLLPASFSQPDGFRCGDRDPLGRPGAVADARYEVRGPADNPDPHLARRAYPGFAAVHGVTPLSRDPAEAQLAVADLAALTRPHAHDDSLGTHAHSAFGHVDGETVADAAGLETGPRAHLDGGWVKGIEIVRPAAPRPASRARVVHAQLGVDGPLEPAAVERVLVPRLGALRDCYRASPASRGARDGRLVLRLTVAREGTVSGVSAAQVEQAPSAVVACMTASLAGLAFPAVARGTSTIDYPLLLVPGGEVPRSGATTLPMAPPLERRPWYSACGAGRRAPQPAGGGTCPRAAARRASPAPRPWQSARGA